MRFRINPERVLLRSPTFHGSGRVRIVSVKYRESHLYPYKSVFKHCQTMRHKFSEAVKFMLRSSELPHHLAIYKMVTNVPRRHLQP